MMITSEDIPWREDCFDGWDFYDVSQSFEFRKRGLRVVVPRQRCAWVMHDAGIMNLVNFDRYRHKCMTEYPEYFSRERFEAGYAYGSKENGSCTKVKLVIIVRNRLEELKGLLETIKAFSGLDESSIIVADNGSWDGLHHFLRRQQGLNYLICNEVEEGYADILNELCRRFVQNEDVLLMTPDILLLPGCVEAMCTALREDARLGVVCAGVPINDRRKEMDFTEAAKYALSHMDIGERREISLLPNEGILIRNALLKKGFADYCFLPEQIMEKLAQNAKAEGYVCCELPNAFTYRLAGYGECTDS